jgi:quinol monooxygenase YgiN
MSEIVQLDFHITPFREKRFVEAYRPAVTRAVEFGAKGYSFYRAEEDPGHFVHISYWDTRKDFDRYWMSRDMKEIRTAIIGLHDHLLLPHYGNLLERA